MPYNLPSFRALIKRSAHIDMLLTSAKVIRCPGTFMDTPASAAQILVTSSAVSSERCAGEACKASLDVPNHERTAKEMPKTATTAIATSHIGVPSFADTSVLPDDRAFGLGEVAALS